MMPTRLGAGGGRRRGALAAARAGHRGGPAAPAGPGAPAAPRRALLLAGAGTLALAGRPASAAEEEGDGFIPVAKLPRGVVEAELKEVRRAVLKVAKELYRGSAADVLQLIYLDSLSYDKERKAGGCNGSIRFPEELKAAGREDLQSAVADITKVQAAASKLLNCEAPVSWADTMVLVGYGAITSLLVDSISSGAKSEQDANIALQGFGNAFPPPRLGRTDAAAPEPDLLPPGAAASGEEIIAAFDRAGVLQGYAACLANMIGDVPEIEKKLTGISGKLDYYVNKYQQSRETFTQTTYQVDYARAYTKVTSLGGNFDAEKYLYKFDKAKLKPSA